MFCLVWARRISSLLYLKKKINFNIKGNIWNDIINKAIAHILSTELSFINSMTILILSNFLLLYTDPFSEFLPHMMIHSNCNASQEFLIINMTSFSLCFLLSTSLFLICSDTSKVQRLQFSSCQTRKSLSLRLQQYWRKCNLIRDY